MADVEAGGRTRQRLRTRKDLMDAAARLMKRGGKPTLEAVAEEAMVSRATAYRYFSSVEALLLEASLDIAFPEAETLFGAGAPEDPAARVELAEAAVSEMVATNEAALRTMLVHSLEQALNGEEANPRVRQNRRTSLIEAALAPGRDLFDPAGLVQLTRALALVIGTEQMLVFKDVLGLTDAEAARVKSWTIRALVSAALKPSR